MSIVITGTGVVSPLGIGKDAFIRAFTRGESRLTGAVDIGARLARVAGFDFGTLFPDRRFRRAAVVTQYALVAAAEALKDAGLDLSTYDGKRVGVVCGVTHGALGYSCDFHKGFSTEGPLGASPVLFSDSVLNALAGALSLAYGIKGPSHTLIGGPDVGVQAVEYGAELVRDGRVDLCLVVAGEALHERTVEAYIKLGIATGDGEAMPAYGEGAGAVVIERDVGAKERGITGLAELASVATMVTPALEDSLRGVVEQALSGADLSSADIAGVMLGGGSDDFEGCVVGDLLPDATRFLPVKELVGEAFCAGTLMNLVVATHLVYEGARAVEGIGAGAAIEGVPISTGVDQEQRILFLVAGHRKEAGCLILKRA